MATKKVTLEILFNELENVVHAKYMGDNKKKIKGNKKLEIQQKVDIKNMEDVINSCCLKNFGIGYKRKYEHLYLNNKIKPTQC